MAEIARIPISNVLTEGKYMMRIAVGSASQPIGVLLDTGSSILAVYQSAYDKSTDADAQTTQLLQTETFASGAFLAAVVHTPIGLLDGGSEVVAKVLGANLAVAYKSDHRMFLGARGVFGLAPGARNRAYRMPLDTWDAGYRKDQLDLGQTVDLEPYVAQLATIGIDKFAFAVQRSTVCTAMADPNQDPLNHGVWVVGDGASCTDLYVGAIATIGVVQDTHYNVNLIALRVGNQVIDVTPGTQAAAGGGMATNAIIDSGANELLLDPDVHAKVEAAFGALNAGFMAAIAKGESQGCDQTTIDLAAWPNLEVILQGADGGQATIAISPKNYWRFDTIRPGTASWGLGIWNVHSHGPAILGLPLFAGHFVMFDRAANNGQGTIGFAPLVDFGATGV